MLFVSTPPTPGPLPSHSLSTIFDLYPYPSTMPQVHIMRRFQIRRLFVALY